MCKSGAGRAPGPAAPAGPVRGQRPLRPGLGRAPAAAANGPSVRVAGPGRLRAPPRWVGWPQARDGTGGPSAVTLPPGVVARLLLSPSAAAAQGRLGGFAPGRCLLQPWPSGGSWSAAELQVFFLVFSVLLPLLVAGCSGPGLSPSAVGHPHKETSFFKRFYLQPSHRGSPEPGVQPPRRWNLVLSGTPKPSSSSSRFWLWICPHLRPGGASPEPPHPQRPSVPQDERQSLMWVQKDQQNQQRFVSGSSLTLKQKPGGTERG